MRKGKSYHIYLKDSTYTNIEIMSRHSSEKSVSDALEEAIIDVYNKMFANAKNQLKKGKHKCQTN